jgi:hypothetical protein
MSGVTKIEVEGTDLGRGEEMDPKSNDKKKDMPPGSMIGSGVAIGAGAGAGLGVAIGNIAIGIGIGVGVGIVIGAILEQRHKKSESDK